MGLLRDFASKPIRSNPVFVLALGLCPTLAVTTALKNGVAMALTTTAVLVCSNVLISLIARWIPNQIRIVVYIVVIAGFVTMVEIVMNAFAPPEIVSALGIFIPLIVVNCIILGRAEGFAARHGPAPSLMDALGIGLGFLGALVAISLIREVLGTGTIWGYRLTPITLGGTTVVPEVRPMSIFIMAPGAFLVIGLLFGLFRVIGERRRRLAVAEAVPAVAMTAVDYPKKEAKPAAKAEAAPKPEKSDAGPPEPGAAS